MKIRTTEVPNGPIDNPKTAHWYDRSRPCKFCNARVLRRLEDPARIVVKHQDRCKGVKGQ